MEQKPKEETEWEARERLGEKPFDKPKWEEEWDRKVNELRNANWNTEEIFEFGYRTQSKDGYVYSIVDFGNIKKFISSLLQRQKEELVKKVQDRLVGFEDTSFEPQYKDYNNGYNQALEETIRIIKDLDV